MKSILTFVISVFITLHSISQENHSVKFQDHIRHFADTIGFAHQQWQMDSIFKRINNTQSELLISTDKTFKEPIKVAICPHDDYTYVGYLYPAILKHIRAKNIILFGVAHKARYLGLEDKLVFDSFDAWACPYGNLAVSSIRELLIQHINSDLYTVNDSMQTMEHSVEALLPFIQKYNPDVKITSILVPYMPFNLLDKIAQETANKLYTICNDNNWSWGKDFAIVISNDAVHYGDEDWGTNQLNYFGGDSTGYQMAMDFESFLVDQCLQGYNQKQRIEALYRYLNTSEDYKKSRWAWCGRFSVPMGLLTSYYLQQLLNIHLTGEKIGYATSIDHDHIKVDDLNMGQTAAANIHHWVGYLGMVYY
ncbi:AmmeMemoRadiSam system protein B [candidate division KSB1 bacterium]